MDPILTVLVLYKLNLEDSAAYQSLTRAIRNKSNKSRLLVYDNSPGVHPIPDSDPWEITYVHDPSNSGVSRAYNCAAAMARQYPIKWLLLADQDTVFPESIYDRYSASMVRYPECSVFVPTLMDHRGIISPFLPQIASGKRLRHPLMGKVSINKINAINSGLMVHLPLFESTGGYDERFKLDFSDFSFFKKLKRQTNHMVIIDATCRHAHSSAEKTNLGTAVNRFQIYLQGSYDMGYGEKTYLIFQLRGLLRAIKLSFEYRSMRFVYSLIYRGV